MDSGINTQSKPLEYKCPNCSAPLSFDPGQQRVACPNCGTVFENDALNAIAQDAKGGGFDWGDFKSSFDCSERLNTKVYQCQGCSALIEADENTAATKCPYCDSNVVLQDRIEGGLKPNAIIPFKKTKEEVPGLVADFYKNKKLLPNNFFGENVSEKVQGVYVPFWLFDANVIGQISMNSSRTSVHRQGDYQVSVTEHFRHERGGDMNFYKVPVDASTKFDDDLMDSIEPYNYSDLTEFSSSYLTGFLADRFDSDPEKEIPRAQDRMVNSAVSALESTVKGYGPCSLVSANMNVRRADVKYVFLPVYLFNCNYMGKLYRYAVNGQTGKVVGELPIDKGKSAMRFILPFIICLVVGALLGLYMGADAISTGLAGGTIIGLIAGLISHAVAKGSMKTVGKAYSARNYLDTNSLRLNNVRDIFLYKTESRTKIQSSSSSSPGGPGGHPGGGHSGPGYPGGPGGHHPGGGHGGPGGGRRF